MAVNSGRDLDAGRDVAGRDVRTEQHVIVGDDGGDPRVSRAGVVVRLEGLELQFARFAEIQAEEWYTIKAEFRATREQIECMMQANAIRQAREDVAVENDRVAFDALRSEVREVRETLFGNGRLGTARWEKITRGMAAFAILVVLIVLAIVVLQGIQIVQIQQQIGVILEALP